LNEISTDVQHYTMNVRFDQSQSSIPERCVIIMAC